MKFGHKDYFYTKKWHKKNYRKISIFRAFFRCFFYTQIQKWCVCSRFPQSLNIKATWNLEFKTKLDQLEKKWKPFFGFLVKFRPLLHIGLWNFDKVNIFKINKCKKKFFEKFPFFRGGRPYKKKNFWSKFFCTRFR